MHLAELLPEVTGKSLTVCNAGKKGISWAAVMLDERRAILSLSGKLMGYSGVTAPDQKLTVIVKDLFLLSGRWFEQDTRIPFRLLKSACNSTGGQQKLAASIQAGFEDVAENIILTLLLLGWESTFASLC